ncbi:MAG: AP2 domain-containing protein [Acidobacteriota bacterium]|nr:AP2 domain-containing protein [Blastocatellia bacterium]MDW8413191.1 AP2 domain-containing protein [Acidobacteriota bacterium]
MSKSGHKGISRIDSNRTHGWYVRVIYQGKICCKFFSDGKYGSSEKALKQAIKFRNAAEKELGKPRTDRVIVTRSPRNKTGIIGVVRLKKDGHEVYEVNWTPRPGVLKRTSISIDKYGEEKAFKMAVRLRRRKEREIYGRPLTRNEEKGEISR